MQWQQKVSAFNLLISPLTQYCSLSASIMYYLQHQVNGIFERKHLCTTFIQKGGLTTIKHIACERHFLVFCDKVLRLLTCVLASCLLYMYVDDKKFHWFESCEVSCVNQISLNMASLNFLLYTTPGSRFFPTLIL